MVITEKLLTHGAQTAESDMEIILRVRTPAGGSSPQRGPGHLPAGLLPQDDRRGPLLRPCQCDSIIMGNAKIKSIPAIIADSMDAQLIHEAAIGRIAEDQITKLMTLGLTEEEAEEKILEGSCSKTCLS